MAGGERGDERPYRVLAEVIDEHEPAIVVDRVRTRGLFLDALGAIERPERTAVAALLAALEGGLPERLLAPGDRSVSLEAEAAALATSGGVVAEDAARAVEGWATALRPPVVGPPGDPDPGSARAATAPTSPAPPAAGGEPAPASARARRRWWVAAGAAGLVTIGLIAAADLGGPDPPPDSTTTSEDTSLDELYDSCAAGDMVACDDLYFASPSGSDDEAFGSTCGEQMEATAGDCVEAAQLQDFQFVTGGDCSGGGEGEGVVLERFCTNGTFEAWFTIWDSGASMAAHSALYAARRSPGTLPNWSYMDVTRGELSIFVLDGDNRVYWTYEPSDGYGGFPMSVELRDRQNDAVQVDQQWGAMAADPL